MKRRTRLFTVIGTLLAGAALVVVPRVASASTVPVYTIVGADTGWCILSNLDNIQAVPGHFFCVGEPNQLWFLRDGRITSVDKGRCLTAEPSVRALRMRNCDPRI